MTKKQEKKKRKIIEDYGFGTKTSGRLMQKDGSFNVIREGASSRHLYQVLINQPWRYFFLSVFSFYFIMNALFALLFMGIGTEYIQGAEGLTLSEQFRDSFFFSVQTFTTLGYGRLNPEGYTMNTLAALNALIGLLCFSLVTGLFFARFSRPDIRIAFSENIIIAPYEGRPALMFRIANARKTDVIDAKAQLVLSWIEKNTIRRFQNIDLDRDFIRMFPLNWTLVHSIDDKSPLYGKSVTWFTENEAEFLIIFEGFDETFAQVIRVNHSYDNKDLVSGVKFDMMYHTNLSGETILNLNKISDYSKVDLPET